MQAPMKNPAMIIPDAAPTDSPRGAGHRTRTIVYWATTLLVSLEMVAGSMWDLLGIEYVRVVMTHLGYPLYVLLIIGVWKLPCAAVLLLPRFPRLKEWAYAGAFFNFTGAAASHALAGDGAAAWIGPTVFAGFTLASWALRPPERRLARATPTTRVRARDWAVPVVVLVGFVVFALLTLPTGPAPW